MATPRTADVRLVAAAVAELEKLAASGDGPAALALLRRMVPEFGDQNDRPGLAVSVAAG
jgi:hypothetical protein